MIGTKITAAISMLSKVPRLLLASHTVRLDIGCDDDGSKNGKALNAAVQMVAAAVVALPMKAIPGRVLTVNHASNAPT